MSKVIDLTQDIFQGMPVYPGHLKTITWEHHTHEETARQFKGGFSYFMRGFLLSGHGTCQQLLDTH